MVFYGPCCTTDKTSEEDGTKILKKTSMPRVVNKSALSRYIRFPSSRPSNQLPPLDFLIVTKNKNKNKERY